MCYHNRGLQSDQCGESPTAREITSSWGGNGSLEKEVMFGITAQLDLFMKRGLQGTLEERTAQMCEIREHAMFQSGYRPLSFAHKTKTQNPKGPENQSFHN